MRGGHLDYKEGQRRHDIGHANGSKALIIRPWCSQCSASAIKLLAGKSYDQAKTHVTTWKIGNGINRENASQPFAEHGNRTPWVIWSSSCCTIQPETYSDFTCQVREMYATLNTRHYRLCHLLKEGGHQT
ncbi:unnamed protein product [Ectocarpus sp. 6 AP-2014]